MDSDIIGLFCNGGKQHIVIVKRRPFVCAQCGFEEEKEAFFGTNGKIVKVGDGLTLIEELDGRIRTVQHQDIRSIESYNPEYARKHHNDWRDE